jgi:heptosyltransferase-1
MGDVLMTTPAASVLRDAFPRASISYVVEEPYKDLVEGSSLFDEVLVLPRNTSNRDFIRFLRDVRKRRYDILLDFHGGPRSSMITFFSGAKKKIGYLLPKKSFLYDVKVPRAPETGRVHSVENHTNLVKALGVSVKLPPPLQMPRANEDEVRRMGEVFSKADLEGKKIVVLHIGAGNEFRDWGASNLAALSESLMDHKDVQVVLVGSEQDSDRVRDILSRTEKPPFSLVGRINLRELHYLISRADLFVGADSGPMHVAASAQTPVVAFFGPTLPQNFAPWQVDARIIQKDLDCRPCRQHQCVHEDFRCLRAITPREIHEACLEFLGK